MVEPYEELGRNRDWDSGGFGRNKGENRGGFGRNRGGDRVPNSLEAIEVASVETMEEEDITEEELTITVRIQAESIFYLNCKLTNRNFFKKIIGK